MKNNKQALIVTSRTALDLTVYNNDDYFIVGVEQGCLELMDQNVKIDLAIGDFDHVNDAEISLIEKYSVITEQLNPQKDSLDGQSALDYVSNEGFYPIKFIVNPSQRVDMNLSVMGLLKSYEQLEIISDETIMYKLDSGAHTIKYVESSYVSFYSLFDDNVISLKNFFYEADNLEANTFSLDFLSNEFKPNTDGIIENKLPVAIIIIK